ncbi:PREDICTED: uncharacterized protein K02A2.6-like [Trachymyrmex cornetzi]|uniref:uncharacterized protein K02A2.6-like n=1 Tax=Trachymyrmex cornetzi TaxID=471704 RepID=UPI00084F5931|nr:PREDICTED: uncharacterized protein K02A2.6-like [Trachymyrmex cornetzi]
MPQVETKEILSTTWQDKVMISQLEQGEQRDKFVTRLQLEVREEDQEYLTLNTHRGLYRPTRLMYGIASAPAIWQREIENILKDIPGVTVFLDDIKVTGTNDAEHLHRLELVFQRLHEYNIKVNLKKSEFFVDKIEYCGYIVDRQGIHKDKKKIEAIKLMPIPKNVTEVTAFIGNADCLSRLPIAKLERYEYDVVDTFQINTIQSLPVTFTELVTATKQDTHLRKILEALQSSKKIDKESKTCINELEYSLQQGVILRGHRVIIPKVLQKRILQELHSVHFGTAKMKMLARGHVWWSGIDTDIEQITRNCAECNANKNNPPKIKHIWEPATFPFERIHIDFAGPFKGHNFLILVDAYTKWPEVHIVNNITTETTIKKCWEIFSRFGLPVQLVSDNGRTFVSTEFQKFLQQNGIKHKLTAPYNPATNGQAERFIQTLKKSLRSIDTQKLDLNTALQRILMQYRITPHCTTEISSAELMFNRKVRCSLDIMKPTVKSHHKEIKMRKEQYREVLERQQEIERPVNSPQLRRSQRSRAPPQRYGDYHTY